MIFSGAKPCRNLKSNSMLYSYIYTILLISLMGALMQNSEIAVNLTFGRN